MLLTDKWPPGQPKGSYQGHILREWMKAFPGSGYNTMLLDKCMAWLEFSILMPPGIPGDIILHIVCKVQKY